MMRRRPKGWIRGCFNGETTKQLSNWYEFIKRKRNKIVDKIGMDRIICLNHDIRYFQYLGPCLEHLPERYKTESMMK